MHELKLFENPEFGSVRIVTVNGEPWLVGKDVALVLGYTNPRKALSDHVDNEDKGVTKCDTLGGRQEMTIIKMNPACTPWPSPANCREHGSSAAG